MGQRCQFKKATLNLPDFEGENEQFHSIDYLVTWFMTFKRRRVVTMDTKFIYKKSVQLGSDLQKQR